MAGEAIAEAFVRLRPETSGFRAETTRQLTGDIKQSERELSRFSRGALVGTGALRGLGRAAAFASTSFIGGAGLVYAIKASVNQATEQTKILANLKNSVEAAGFSWKTYGQQIQQATQRTKEASAFDDEQLYQSLQLLIRGTGDVNKALKLNALAADVARGRNLGLVQSAQLLVRVNAGQVGSLRRLGIQVDKNASGAQALAQVQRQYAGAAEAFSRTAAGAQERLTVGIQDTEKAIGRALLPTITRLEGRLADWLNKTENQRRVQRGVNDAIKDATAVVNGLKGAFDVISPAIKEVTGEMGGLEKATRNLILLFAGWKAAKLAREFRTVGLAAGPKGAAGEVGALAAATSRLPKTPIVIPIVLGLSVRESSTFKQIFGPVQKALGPLGFILEGPKDIYRQFNQAIKNVGAFGQSKLKASQVVELINKGELTPDTLAKLQAIGLLEPGAYKAGIAAYKRQGNFFGDPIRAFSGFGISPPAAHPIRPEPTLAPAITRGRFGVDLLTRAQRNDLALAAAARTQTTADDLKALREQRAILASAIAVETRRLNNAATAKQAQKYADALKALEQQDASAADQIQSIEQQAAQAAKQKADSAARASAKARKAREDAAKKLVADREAEARADAQAVFAGVKLGVDTDKLKRAYEKAQAAKAKAAATAVSIREGALTLARQAADLAVARAGSNQALLDKATLLEKKADEALIRFYKERIKATKGLERQNYQQQLINAQIDLAGLGKKAAASSGFTLAQLYQEAESEYKLYGSNYGSAGAPLSPQQARGSFSGLALKRKGDVHVTQVFLAPTRPSQAMNDARAGARYLN